MASRFPTTWIFEDYGEAELRLIFDKMVADRKLKTDQMRPSISRVVAARLARGSGKPGFGNARSVRNVIDTAVKRLSERLAPRVLEQQGSGRSSSGGGGGGGGGGGSSGSSGGGSDGGAVTDDEAVTLTREDVLGAKPDLSNSPELAELRRMTGLDEVKDKVVELMHLQLANWDRESRGEKALEVPLHRIFFGKPGTGKTTVAKIFGRLLKRFGFLSNGEVVVKGPADFLGDVVGASEKKTIDILDACRGKVLLLDEVGAAARRPPLTALFARSLAMRPRAHTPTAPRASHPHIRSPARPPARPSARSTR